MNTVTDSIILARDLVRVLAGAFGKPVQNLSIADAERILTDALALAEGVHPELVEGFEEELLILQVQDEATWNPVAYFSWAA